ncbi:MAG: tetratricopeptide repeat protein [Bryobacteraceae bacterium]|nr:tetratricopeptide repeat protein [Bryobacteraceae bacterium]
MTRARTRDHYQDAETACRQALTQVEAPAGAESPDAANLLNELAGILNRRGNWSQELECATRSVSIMRGKAQSVEGLDGYRILVQGQAAAGRALRELGRYQESEAALGALRTARRHLGPAAHETNMVRIGLGVLLKKYMGRLEEAERLYRRALVYLRGQGDQAGIATVLSGEIRHKLPGPNHPDTLAHEAALAAILDAGGQYAEAEQIYLRVLRGFERCFGPEHLEIAVNLNNLAALKQAMGDMKEARRLYRRSLEMKRKLLGAHHPECALTEANLATTRSPRAPRRLSVC